MELVFRDTSAGVASEQTELQTCVVLTGSEAVSRLVGGGGRTLNGEGEKINNVHEKMRIIK